MGNRFRLAGDKDASLFTSGSPLLRETSEIMKFIWGCGYTTFKVAP